LSRRRRSGGSGGSHDGGGMMRWLLTYADLITLLMVFFVVMYAMSNLDKKKYETMSASLRQAFNVEGSANDLIANQSGDMKMPVPQSFDTRALEDTEFQRIIDRIKSTSTVEEMNSMIFIIDERGLVISFLDTLLFDLGRADLRPNALSVIDRFATSVQGTMKIIRVEGHTDDLPIATLQYPSNWELSAARAITVTRYLITKHPIDPRRLSATGYGEYRPKASNDSEANRRKNRRVDIVVLRASINVLETK
jgi:chemotaxis protein MotB